MQISTQDKPTTILLVEDDSTEARLIWRLLLTSGATRDTMRIEYANIASVALARLKSGGIDAVLLNLSIPDSQGIDVFLKMRHQAPSIPILVLTTCADEALGLEAIKQGAQDHLVKEQIDGLSLTRSVRYAIERAHLLDQLHTYAIRDELTGLYNRREMDRVLHEEMDRYRRYGRPVSLVILDIDDFKAVNDTYGHHAGDCVLREVGRLLASSLRSLDRPARYGGEELAIILSETPAENAFIVGERMRELLSILPFTVPQDNVLQGQSIASPPFPLPLPVPVPVPMPVSGSVPSLRPLVQLSITVSVGVASVSPEIRTTEELLIAADQALYIAKSRGRNRTILFGQGSQPQCQHLVAV